MDLEKYYGHILNQYPEYVTQGQMCEICRISKKTAYKLEQSGRIPYIEETNRLIRTHKIKISDVLKYLYEKECRQEPDSKYIIRMREYYRLQFAYNPDVLSSDELQELTGFSMSGILTWLKNGILKSFLIKQKYKIPKDCLIDFMVSSYYRSIKNKSQKQKSDMVDFEKWYAEHLLKEITELQKYIGQYSKTREVYSQYRDSKWSKKFAEAHYTDIALHKAAKKYFDGHGLKKLPTINMLKQEYAILSAEQKKISSGYKENREEMVSLLMAKQNVDRILFGTPTQVKNLERCAR